MRTARRILLPLLLASAVVPASAQTVGEPRLVGISTLPGARQAYLIVESSRGRVECKRLREGDRDGDLMLASIDAQAHQVEVVIAGRRTVLSFDAAIGEDAVRARGSAMRQGTSSLRFQQLPLADLLTLYGEMTGRTVLRASSLPRVFISLNGTNVDSAGAARLMEAAMQTNRVRWLNAGEKFVYVAEANRSLPPEGLSATRCGAPQGSVEPGQVRFHAAPLDQVLEFYAELSGRIVLRANSLPQVPLTLSLVSALSRAELLDGFDALFALNGITTTCEGTKFVMLHPGGRPAPVPPQRSIDTTTANDPVPSGQIRLRNAPINQVLPFYSELVGRKTTVARSLPMIPVALHQTVTLTRSEGARAIELVLALNGVSLVDMPDASIEAMPTAQAVARSTGSQDSPKK